MDCLLSICDALEIIPEQLLAGKGIGPEYKDADMDYEVTRADIRMRYLLFHGKCLSYIIGLVGCNILVVF